MNLTERAAYLKGLADGGNFNPNSADGKLIAELIKLVSDMAEEIAEMDERIDTAFAYCEELDEDLGTVEEYLLDDEDEYDCDDCDCDCDDCDCCCDCDDEEFSVVECAACGEEIYFDGEIDPEDLVCPACGAKFECLVSEDAIDAVDAE